MTGNYGSAFAPQIDLFGFEMSNLHSTGGSTSPSSWLSKIPFPLYYIFSSTSLSLIPLVEGRVPDTTKSISMIVTFAYEALPSGPFILTWCR